MNTQRRGTTPPHNRVRAVTNSLRVESPNIINDLLGRRERVFRWLIHEIRAAIPRLHSSSSALRSGTPEAGLVLL